MINQKIKREISATLQLAIPISFGNLSHMLMALIDTLMVARLGINALAASSLASAVFGFFLITSIGMTSVVGPLVAKQKGAKNDRGCGKVFFNALFVNGCSGALIASFIYMAACKVNLFNPPDDIIALSKSYLTIIAPTLIFITLFNTLRQFSEALSRPKPVIYFLFGSLALNAFFNWLLIFGHWGFPRLELDGAGYGTLLARLLATLTLAVYIFRHQFYKPFLPKTFKLSGALIKAHLRIGIPSSLQYSSEAAAFSGAGILMGWLGKIPLAAHQIALNMASMTFMAALGTSVATSIRVGQAYGQKNLKAARRSGFTGIAIASLLMVICGIVFYFGRYYLPTLYINSPEIIRETSRLLIVAALFQVFDASQAVALGALKGLMDVSWPTGITIISYCGVSLPIAYYCAFTINMGSIGIWLGLLAGLITSSTALNIRFHLLTR